MSEQRNIEIIHEMYAAFSRGDVASIVERLTDDVESLRSGCAMGRRFFRKDSHAP